MTNVEIKVVVTATKPISAWWACVNDTDLHFNNGEAVASIPDDGEHIFFYWFFGDPGGKITFKIFKDNDVRLKGEDSLPPGYFRGGNARIFKMS